MTQAYPLHWPKEWPRSKRTTSSQFRTSIAGALKNVKESVRKFSSDSGKKIDAVTISSNVTLGEQKPSDSGVAIYFTWDGISTCIAVDRYAKVEDNLQAIHHCIEAERTKLRHGGLNLVRAAFRGYAALPPPSATKSWWGVLGMDETCNDVRAVEAQYKILALKLHPDNPNNENGHEAMADLNVAIEQAREALS